MSTSFRVSVVVTHYNQTNWLPLALHSLDRQTVKPYEVIFVDDGSKVTLSRTEVFGILKHIPKVTAICKRQNEGIGAALNTAIRNMSGNVFCWLPSDDEWNPEKLERQAEFAKLHPGHVLHSYAALFEGTDYVRDGRPMELGDDEFASVIRTESPYYGNTFWIPKVILDQVGPFREGIPASEDYEWVLRSVVLHGIKYRLQKESLTINRKHENTTTARHIADIPALMRQFNEEVGW